CAVGCASGSHDRPPLIETVAPPSFASAMRCGSLGAIQRSWLSVDGVAMAVSNLAPPSSERNTWTLRTYTRLLTLGSAKMREKYHARWRSLRSALVRCQVAPASSERNTPPESASTSAHTRLGAAADTANPMLPITPLGRPGACVSSVQCSPPSLDLKMPLPAPPDDNNHGVRPACQSAAYRTSGLVGSSTSSMAPVESLRKRILRQCTPPSVDL